MNYPEPMVFVVDDDPSILGAVSRLFRLADLNVRTFGSPSEFLRCPDLDMHGCIVLDLAMPGCNGLELQKCLRERGCGMPIIFLTGRADVSTSVRALKEGAVDLLTKPVDESTLLAAVRSAIARDRVALNSRLEVKAIRARLATLTPREYEVFEHVVSGRLNKQTAAALGTAEKTIKVHRARVMEKLQVQSLADLVRLAEHAGVTPQEMAV